MDPYVQPISESDVPRKGAPSSFWTWAFAAVTLVRIVVVVGAFVSAALGPRFGAGETLVTTVWTWCSYTSIALFLAELVCMGRWLTHAWTALPPAERKVGERDTTPATAVAFLCIPFFNYYWMFAMNVALCEAYESRVYGAKRKETDLAGRGLVLSAAWLTMAGLFGALAMQTPLHVLQYAGSIAAPLFWFFYMRHVDHLKARMESAREIT